MNLKVNKTMISFSEIPAIAAESLNTRLLVRHSFRESLKQGNYDPGLTAEGFEYAKECGSRLKGMKDVCFGASNRKRTMETVRAIIEGAGFESSEIVPCPLLHDTAIFEDPATLGKIIEDGTIPHLLKEYFYTGKAAGFTDVRDFSKTLSSFLTETEFRQKNVILASHDIVIVALLVPFEIYPFQQDDWFGYLHGAFLRQDLDRNWEIFYAVPDKSNRTRYSLFI